MALPFADRKDAARQLLAKLQDLKDENPLVLAVPRGAVPMAKIIADGLGAELDIVLVKKIGHPRQSEFALGAVSEGGEVFFSEDLARHHLSPGDLEADVERQKQSLRERRLLFTPGRKPVPVAGRTVIVVDDGIATGATMSVALRSLKAQGAQRLVVAAPVASSQSIPLLEREGAEVRVVAIPASFGAVSSFYDQFGQVSDREVSEYFRVHSRAVAIENGDIVLHADLGLAQNPRGVVLFAHGSGSGRSSPRNRMVASVLNKNGFSTALADLLTESEARDRENVFDIDLLAGRLVEIAYWIARQDELRRLRIGLFGASTGAGAALQAAARLRGRVSAVVSRGGRPDLAGPYLPRVEAPTLLIVGGEDTEVLALNERAYRELLAEKRIEIVAGAGHLFAETGTLEIVADLAVSWFSQHLGVHSGRRTQNLEP